MILRLNLQIFGQRQVLIDRVYLFITFLTPLFKIKQLG